ncbi:ribbon-helix-helix protein, CopG family [Streptomyces sp. NPDC057798]|uniref:ribbon-helix-helix domain-containing protein n=1 Tax=Streptomyces sp. NPDC057798 TaxID=3346252 RepID=UPI0036944CD6
MGRRGQPRLVEDEETLRISVLLPESLYNELKDLVERESRSLSYLAREAVKHFLYMKRIR